MPINRIYQSATFIIIKYLYKENIAFILLAENILLYSSRKAFQMKKNLLNITLFSIFTLCALPTIASENQTEESSKTTSEQIESQTLDVSEENQNLPDIKAVQIDRAALLFAGCLFTSIALVITLHKLAQTKDELTLYKASHTAQTLISLDIS